MTPERFCECLAALRWPPVTLANVLQCDLAFVEALQAGKHPVPAQLGQWLDSLARTHDALAIPAYHGIDAAAGGQSRPFRLAA